VDNKQVIEWITAAAARGIAWVLAGKLGLAAATADELSMTVAAALAALAVAGFSVYSSIKGRQTLLMTDPPASKT